MLDVISCERHANPFPIRRLLWSATTKAKPRPALQFRGEIQQLPHAGPQDGPDDYTGRQEWR
jgi:hypothetical protein